tara:strand:- start:3857 stop:4966 length:1110 start_codon:yes stop_codon:yes gene_type:complete
MKQYKHKTSDHIATQSKSGKTYTLINPMNTVLPKEFVEDSCDWELVEDEVIDNRDYEVLSYTNDFEMWVKIKGKNTFGRATCRHIQMSETDLLNTGPFNINAIKRKSDNANFIVKGIVTPSFSEMVFGEVSKLEPIGNTIQIWGKFNGMYGMGFLNQMNPLVPKDHEVLELMNPVTGSILTIENGICVDISSMPNANGVAIAQAISMLDWSRLNITKIKRYSDGSDISVGGMIKNMFIPNKKSKILNISIVAGQIRVKTTLEKSVYYLLHDIVNITPVFTTEDGVDVFIDDKYFAIQEYSKEFSVVPYYVNNNNTPKGIKQYSTHEAASNVLMYYKRNISIFDIEAVFGKLSVNEYNELLKISTKNGRG